jgi:hypothetical protein
MAAFVATDRSEMSGGRLVRLAAFAAPARKLPAGVGPQVFYRACLGTTQAFRAGLRFIERLPLLDAAIGLCRQAEYEDQFQHRSVSAARPAGPVGIFRRVQPGVRAIGGFLLAGLLLAAAPAPPPEQPGEEPLSPAQVLLFETPHLKSIEHPVTLEYSFHRVGPGAFDDRVLERIGQIHPDGTKFVNIDFLSGDHHQFFPAVDDFRGNPLLMLFLEHDVQQMKAQIGVAAAYFRDRVRKAFIDRASIEDVSVSIDGKTVPARRITMRPFATDPRFADLPAVQNKTYVFVLTDAVPGMLQELRVDVPADPSVGAPALSEQLVFKGERP